MRLKYTHGCIWAKTSFYGFSAADGTSGTLQTINWGDGNLICFSLCFITFNFSLNHHKNPSNKMVYLGRGKRFRFKCTNAPKVVILLLFL